MYKMSLSSEYVKIQHQRTMVSTEYVGIVVITDDNFRLKIPTQHSRLCIETTHNTSQDLYTRFVLCRHNSSAYAWQLQWQ